MSRGLIMLLTLAAAAPSVEAQIPDAVTRHARFDFIVLGETSTSRVEEVAGRRIPQTDIAESPRTQSCWLGPIGAKGAYLRMTFNPPGNYIVGLRARIRPPDRDRCVGIGTAFLDAVVAGLPLGVNSKKLLAQFPIGAHRVERGRSVIRMEGLRPMTVDERRAHAAAHGNAAVDNFPFNVWTFSLEWPSGQTVVSDVEVIFVESN